MELVELVELVELMAVQRREVTAMVCLASQSARLPYKSSSSCFSIQQLPCTGMDELALHGFLS